MFPDNSSNQPSQPGSLPVVSYANQPSPTTDSQVGQIPAATDLALHVAAQAKQLCAQYGTDPHRLSDELSRLKAAYLAQQYQITPSRSEH